MTLFFLNQQSQYFEENTKYFAHHLAVTSYRAHALIKLNRFENNK